MLPVLEFVTHVHNDVVVGEVSSRICLRIKAALMAVAENVLIVHHRRCARIHLVAAANADLADSGSPKNKWSAMVAVEAPVTNASLAGHNRRLPIGVRGFQPGHLEE